MSKQQKGGMRSAFHYVVEFAVILLGISVSVFIEKNNARDYKESVKDQSLSRILTNIRQDSADYVFNMSVHKPAAESCAWMFERRDNIAAEHPDSVGKHCSMCLMAQTIFMDNQEEYRTLQNSGLIELIENDKLARALQGKYVQHEFLRKIEKFVADAVRKAARHFLPQHDHARGRRFLYGLRETQKMERIAFGQAVFGALRRHRVLAQSLRHALGLPHGGRQRAHRVDPRRNW